MSRIHILTVSILFLSIAGGYLLMAWHYPVAYILATYEDLYGEWAQTWTFAAACLFCLLQALRASRYRWFFILLTVATFYVFMEEISWGQRLIGFESPEFMQRYNLQQEANLHNLLVGPVSTTTKAVVEIVLATALLLYGLVYPLMLRAGWQPAPLFDRFGVAAPPLYLWPFFTTAAWLELGPLGFNEAEVAELLIATALVVMAVHYRALPDEGLVRPHRHDWSGRASARMAVTVLLIAGVIGLLATATTRHMLNDEETWRGIDGRILNGYEKFASRYAGYGRWDITLYLLDRVHRREPHRTSVLRRMAKAARSDGDEAAFSEFAQRALEIDLEKYANDPDSRSVNLSLARTYLLLEQRDDMHTHSQQAFDLALRRVQEQPERASNYYWLAKVQHFRGDYEAALAAYEHAWELQPGSTKYREAYFKMRRIMNEADG